MDPALVSVIGVVKDRQVSNPEEASNTPGVKAKKTKGSEVSNSRNERQEDRGTKREGEDEKASEVSTSRNERQEDRGTEREGVDEKA